MRGERGSENANCLSEVIKAPAPFSMLPPAARGSAAPGAVDGEDPR